MSDSDTRDQKAGGVGTMPRPAAPPRRPARPRPPAEPGQRPGLPDGVRLASSAPSVARAPSVTGGAQGVDRLVESEAHRLTVAVPEPEPSL